MERVFDYAIFGAGVVGSCIFDKLTSLGQSAILLEKNMDVATGQSKANTALVHAGFDAKPNTLKAKLNVLGNQMYEDICMRLGIPFERCGAVVVDKTRDVLDKLLLRGQQNGVKDLEIISDQKLYDLVPNLKKDYKFGLWAKSAGIVSPFLFAIALCEEAVVNGGQVLFDFDATKITFCDDVFEIESKNAKIFAKKVINCAGFGYNQIAKLLGEKELDIKFRRGEYFVLDNNAKGFVNVSVFPAPSDMGKGILATPTIDGNILLGPNAQDCDWDTKTTSEGLKQVKDGINQMFDNVPWKSAIRIYSGIRTIVGDDFVIELGKNPNVVNIAGICSPGLSSSPAIAEYVCKDLLCIVAKEKQMKKRCPYVDMNKLSFEQQNQIISQNKQFGKIVCKCEKVSEGEILQAINSPLRPKSIDGIKKRVRAGMGRCQGGFCTIKVAKLIAEQNGCKMEDVIKENQNSNICLQNFENGFWEGDK